VLVVHALVMFLVKIKGLLHVTLMVHVQQPLMIAQEVVKIQVILLTIVQVMGIAVHYHGLAMDLKIVKIKLMAVI
tara:strand:- start:280 stop:504 length:225 start_codon:yes stop_codon:yes gene_type:complete